MDTNVKGKDVLNALSELKGPVNLTEIVEHLLPNYEGSKADLLEKVKTVLEAGVQHGYVQENDSKFHMESSEGNKDENQQAQSQDQQPEAQHLQGQSKLQQKSSKKVNKTKTATTIPIKSVMSVNELHSSSVSLIEAKTRRHVARKLRTVCSSDDDEEVDQGDCCGSRFRRRSRSGRRGKCHSRRRSRRRR